MVLRTLFLCLIFFGLLSIYSCKSEYSPVNTFHTPPPLEVVEEIILQPLFVDGIIDWLAFLSKDSTILSKLTINSDTIHWYSEQDSTTYQFSVNELEAFNSTEKNEFISSTLGFQAKKNRPVNKLAGMRIAIDPGHNAHDLPSAKIEGKYIEFLKQKTPRWPQILSWLNLS